jgi:hypothetical protein
MVLRTKVPESCADLSPAKVERMLEKHFGDIYAAARELGVSGPDLRRLTWAQPELLEHACLFSSRGCEGLRGERDQQD